MTLSAAQLQSLSLLLDEALLQPEGDRLVWLGRQEGLAVELRAKLESLLGEGSAYTLPPLPKYREEPGGEGEADGLAASAAVGPYRLLRELGRGGMGSVWLAERSDGSLKRQVALKLPHSSLPQQQLAERFGRERDILAGLVHPHIARLYDAGVTAEGRPWLALEYVEGRPLSDYCQEHALDLEARLVLFQQVLAAVQYAHGQLVVHRDLKPGNILVTADGQVRLLDFGIAKLLVDGEAQETELTQMGGRALTPQYAAPEQLLGQPIGTAADIYALGVVLYELLAEVLPYRLKRETRGELEQAILDGELVPPSQQAATAWKKRLKGDLDTIILKALKKAPAERYATAAAFGEDIERSLKGEPVLAQPDSAGYRARKFLGRHRLGVGAAVLVVVALAVGLGIALWQAEVARQEAAKAEKEARTARAVKEFMQGIFLANTAQQADPMKARETTARELLDIGTTRIDESLNDAPEAKREMLQLFAELYSQLLMTEKAADLADRQLDLVRQQAIEDPMSLVAALVTASVTRRSRWMDDPRQWPPLEEAATLLDRQAEESPLARSVVFTLSGEYWIDREFSRVLDAMRHAMVIHQHGEDVTGNALRAARAELLAGNWSQAAATARKGLDNGEKQNAEVQQGQGKTGDGGYLQEAGLLEVLALAAVGEGEPGRADQLFRQAVAAARRTFGPDDPETARLVARRASVAWFGGQGEEANRLLDEAEATLGVTHAGDRSKLRYEALAVLGNAQADLGHHRQALGTLTTALAMRDPALDASPAIAGVLRDQARALAGLGRKVEAARVLARAVAMRQKSGISPPAVLQAEAALSRRLAAPASR